MNSSPVFGRSPKNVLTIRIKLAGAVNMDELQLFLDGKLAETPNCKKGNLTSPPPLDGWY